MRSTRDSNVKTDTFECWRLVRSEQNHEPENYANVRRRATVIYRITTTINLCLLPRSYHCVVIKRDNVNKTICAIINTIQPSICSLALIIRELYVSVFSSLRLIIIVAPTVFDYVNHLCTPIVVSSVHHQILPLYTQS